MTSQPSVFFRWFRVFARKFRWETTAPVKSPETPVLSSVECYACTRPGVPAFHSTSCDHPQALEWRASAGSSLVPIQHGPDPKPVRAQKKRPLGPFGVVLDPRTKRVRKWNRTLLLARGIALAVDPFFFYSLCVDRTAGPPNLYMDRALLEVVTVLRFCVDAFHLWHVWLQFRSAYISRESLVVGNGMLVWDPRAIACHYARSLSGFWFDLLVILPAPQAMFWLIIPKLIREEKIKWMMEILLLIFLFQYVPKIYHFMHMIRRIQKAPGYIFGTIWFGLALNFIVYYIASHVIGACWYALAVQRVDSCIRQQCIGGVNSSCIEDVCLNPDGPFLYGIYREALPVITTDSLAFRLLCPMSWGFLILSTVGNVLTPSSNLPEVIFCILLMVCGLLLFTLMVANIQVFLHAVMVKKKKVQLRSQDLEWWMSRRQLPSRLRRRVRRFERQRCTALAGEEEMNLIQDLPQGLRRDIKRYLCIDLINKVPLFSGMNELILDNIVDRVRPLIFSKDEKIIREGDPVQRMMFIVRGRAKRSQNVSKGVVATSTLESGGYLGDELLSWCLRKPFLDRLPPSSATFECTDSVEAFGLESNDLRTWGAMIIQLAWRRYLKRTGRDSGDRTMVSWPENCGDSDRKLLQYAAMFISIRPHDHLQ
ncbi:PREDICTED: cyclic nucleotide-gated ion channel 2-like isoform X2 [Tarenaya hassleriana]|uniref:cyclic nucleotide-gated ion channel 2-like isoform X2 n=1 Tax=Tarenaya hassleriana TaxID=28532 RepID=UPI00053C6630|nr:PREDICTED: cyclic nucleotide-gated ion channel 2-like isoform X2 [Tarenaya hassleriana]